MSIIYTYPVAEAVSRIRALSHPQDLAEIVDAVADQVQRLCDGAEGRGAADLRRLAGGAVQSLEDASSSLRLAADDSEVDFERAEAVGRLRRDIMRAVRAA